MSAITIEEVIAQLDEIIAESKANNSPLGYFAALYCKVTRQVRDKLGTGYFQDDERMHHLDIVFANRYLTAYQQYQAYKKDKNTLPPTKSWLLAFQLAEDDELVVLQHLLLGMNAHINLDLGIAVAEITTPATIQDLHHDFNKINELLQSLVGGVEEELGNIWPFLRKVLRYTKQVDDFIVRFSMKEARDGAWRFAVELSGKSGVDRAECIATRDNSIEKIGHIVAPQGWIERLIFWWIKRGERGTIRQKIEELE